MTRNLAAAYAEPVRRLTAWSSFFEQPGGSTLQDAIFRPTISRAFSAQVRFRFFRRARELAAKVGLLFHRLIQLRNQIAKLCQADAVRDFVHPAGGQPPNWCDDYGKCE